MTKPLPILALVLLPSLTQAKIGETKAEFEARWGKPVSNPMEEGKQKEDFDKLFPGAHFYRNEQALVGAWYKLGKLAGEMHGAGDDDALIAVLGDVTGTTEWDESNSPNFFLQMAGFQSYVSKDGKFAAYVVPNRVVIVGTAGFGKDLEARATQTALEAMASIAPSAGEGAAERAERQQQIVNSLKIENLSSYTTGGYLRVRGDVTNTGTVAVKGIQVEIQYLDTEGKVIDQNTAYVDSWAYVLPGATGTFSTIQSNREGSIVSHKARIVTADQANESQVEKQQQILNSLKLENLSNRAEGSYLKIRGDVTNTGTVPVKGIQVEITYLDAQGKVDDQESAYVDSWAYVLPGKTGTFSTTKSTKDTPIVSHKARIVPSFSVD